MREKASKSGEIVLYFQFNKKHLFSDSNSEFKPKFNRFNYRNIPTIKLLFLQASNKYFVKSTNATHFYARRGMH